MSPAAQMHMVSAQTAQIISSALHRLGELDGAQLAEANRAIHTIYRGAGLDAALGQVIAIWSQTPLGHTR